MINRITGHYQRLYNVLCGVHPHRRPWHSQWLSVKDLYRDLHRVLPNLEGRLLDIGCRSKPYAYLATGASEYIGIDVEPGPSVDHVIHEGIAWPLEDASFQSALCTQVIELVPDIPHFISEIDRVLCPNGIVVITAPFCYNDLSIMHNGVLAKDLWRHSIHGLRALFPKDYEVLEATRQGGAGSTLGLLLLNWIDITLSSHRITRLMLIALFPVWIIFCFTVNMLGALWDKLDRTESFYHNSLLILRKKTG